VWRKRGRGRDEWGNDEMNSRDEGRDAWALGNDEGNEKGGKGGLSWECRGE
jgi:hypothetical protein